MLPAEAAHNLAILGLRLTPPSLLRTAFGPTPQKPTKLFGLTFPNPVGLAAGMDKNASALRAWLQTHRISAHCRIEMRSQRSFELSNASTTSSLCL
ncbi:MAG: hypothetical protein NTZ08_01400 [Verrucomicrobia bacterium]|nr:hypothetical protein [Verrucomicrobiota bacterium]